jgi:Sec-independent protein translocase protein TatA
MISGTEYLVIALAIFLIFGPRRLPELARKVGGWLREARVVVAQIRETIEAETGDLTQPLKDVSDEARKLRAEGTAAFRWTGPVHDSGPSPEDALDDLDRIEGDREPDEPPEAADGS